MRSKLPYKGAETVSPRSAVRSRMILGASVCLAIASLSVGVWGLLAQQRIGIVRIAKIIERYEGAIDAKASFRKKTMEWGANVDTLRADVQKLVFEYEGMRGDGMKGNRDSLARLIRTKQAQIDDYQRALTQKTTDEQQLLTEGIVAQVRSAAEAVAAKDGIDLMIAVQDDGSILASNSEVDYTDIVLEALRLQYRGQFKDRRKVDRDGR